MNLRNLLLLLGAALLSGVVVAVAVLSALWLWVLGSALVKLLYIFLTGATLS